LKARFGQVLAAEQPTNSKRSPRRNWGAISIVAQQNGLRLLYWVTTMGEWLRIDKFVPSATPRPGSAANGNGSCARGAVVVAGGYLVAVISGVCWQCHGLTYASRNLSPAQRAMYPRRQDREPAARKHVEGTTKGKWQFPPKHPACAGGEATARPVTGSVDGGSDGPVWHLRRAAALAVPIRSRTRRHRRTKTNSH
jgi:hypothetical protein